MPQITTLIQKVPGLSTLGHAIQDKIVISIAIILLLSALRWITLRVIQHRIDRKRLHARYQWRKGSAYATIFLGILIVGRIWIQDMHAIVTYLGLLSAGIAIALKDPIVNFVGWFFILWRRPFQVGDRIQIGGIAGDVIDQRLFEFLLMEVGNWVHADQSTGRIIHIPNGRIFTDPVANYNKGFRYLWNEVLVLLTFESNWGKAKAILQRIAEEQSLHLRDDARQGVREAGKTYLLYYTHLTPTVYTSVEDSGVLLTIRHLCRPTERRDSSQAIWESILREFARHDDIDFAYPTQRFFDNRSEGKPGVKQASGSGE